MGKGEKKTIQTPQWSLYNMYNVYSEFNAVEVLGFFSTACSGSHFEMYSMSTNLTVLSMWFNLEVSLAKKLHT